MKIKVKALGLLVFLIFGSNLPVSYGTPGDEQGPANPASIPVSEVQANPYAPIVSTERAAPAAIEKKKGPIRKFLGLFFGTKRRALATCTVGLLSISPVLPFADGWKVPLAELTFWGMRSSQTRGFDNTAQVEILQAMMRPEFSEAERIAMLQAMQKNYKPRVAKPDSQTATQSLSSITPGEAR